jgi:hypothetical protein
MLHVICVVRDSPPPLHHSQHAPLSLIYHHDERWKKKFSNLKESQRALSPYQYWSFMTRHKSGIIWFIGFESLNFTEDSQFTFRLSLMCAQDLRFTSFLPSVFTFLSWRWNIRGNFELIIIFSDDVRCWSLLAELQFALGAIEEIGSVMGRCKSWRSFKMEIWKNLRALIENFRF